MWLPRISLTKSAVEALVCQLIRDWGTIMKFSFSTSISYPVLRFGQFFLATILVAFSAASYAQVSLFDHELPDEMKWSQVTPVGSLMVGGKNYLAHYMSDGELLWVRDDVTNLAAFNVGVVPGLPYVVISDLIAKIPQKSRLMVLDLMTGETIWETEDTMGSNLGGYAIPESGSVVFVRDISGEKGIKAGTYISKFDLATGEEVWQTRIGAVGTLKRHNIDDNGFISGQDLSGHPRPIITDDSFLLFAGDIYSFDLATGSQRWHYKLKAGHKALKKTYARPILDGGTLYAAGPRNVVALNVADGTERWTTKLSKAAIPQLELAYGLLVGRYGGTFSDGKKFAQLKPFGAFALSSSDGAKKWEWKKAKHSVTNLAVLPGLNKVVLADKTTLYALQLDASKAKIVTKEKLEFKRKMGTADVAAKGLGAVGGFLSGGLGGAASSMTGGDRSDPPLEVSLYKDQIIVRGQFHVLGYDMNSGSTAWSVEFAPPGMNGLALVAMSAVAAGASYGNAIQSRSSSSFSTANAFAGSTANINNAFQAMVSSRFAASETDANVGFFLTKEDDDRLLVGLDMQTGDRIGAIPMKEKEPRFMVDAIDRLVYYFAGSTRVAAYDFSVE